MEHFDGRLFGPGLPGAGIKATARWREDGSLVVTTVDRDVEAAEPQVAAGGFNHARLRLFWRDAAGEYALILDGEAARSACLTTAPARLASQLTAAAGRRSQVERRFRLGWAALIVLLLLPLVALGVFFWKQDVLAEWVVQRIPVAQEVQLGELVLAQSRAQYKLQEDGPAIEALRTIGAQLTVGSFYHYRWFVADAPEINAFAAPGGVVVVNAGLLRAVTTPEELAGVLAHEIAHAELRHSLKTLVKGLGLRALVTIALGDLSGSAVADAAKQLTNLSFSRQAEQEADREGLRRLVAARIDPQGMVRFFERLTKEQTLSPPALLSTHPAPAERLAELQREVATLQREWHPLTVDLDAVHAGLAIQPEARSQSAHRPPD